MKTVVGFLSRAHGLNVLEFLLKSKKYKLVKLYTHSLNPKSQDPFRRERKDFKKFQKICQEQKIPLETIDDKNEGILNCPECDFIIEVSWRYLIPSHITKKAKICAFGIHRGKLPEYAGAEPIKQALKNKEKEIILSAHLLEQVIDGGSTLMTISFSVNYEEKKSFDDNVQKIREQITPLFSKLTEKILKKLITEK